MSSGPPRRPATVSRLVGSTEVPPKSVGIFWLGGATVAIKSSGKRVYLFDPGFRSVDGGGPVGAIDVRPDLVVCTFHSPSRFNLPSLTHLSAAFPEVRFAGSETAREWMTGQYTTTDAGADVPVNPGRVVMLTPGATVDVRKLGVQDQARIRVLEDARDGPSPWNVQMTMSGLRICLIREAAALDRLDRLCEVVRVRPDVLIWSLEGEDMERISDGLQRLRPRYALPVGYDGLAGGGDLARRFRDAAESIPSTRCYLFPEDYQEGLVYSRLLQRTR